MFFYFFYIFAVFDLKRKDSNTNLPSLKGKFLCLYNLLNLYNMCNYLGKTKSYPLAEETERYHVQFSFTKGSLEYILMTLHSAWRTIFASRSKQTVNCQLTWHGILSRRNNIKAKIYNNRTEMLKIRYS